MDVELYQHDFNFPFRYGNVIWSPYYQAWWDPIEYVWVTQPIVRQNPSAARADVQRVRANVIELLLWSGGGFIALVALLANGAPTPGVIAALAAIALGPGIVWLRNRHPAVLVGIQLAGLALAAEHAYRAHHTPPADPNWYRPGGGSLWNP